jgi:hypothetical protein
MHQFIETAGLPGIPEFDPVSAEHFFCLIVTYRVIDPAAALDDTSPTYFDRENLVDASPLICLHCEEAYDKAMAADPCPGNPPPA